MNLLVRLLLVTCTFTCFGILAQSTNSQFKITGKVTDFNNNPVKGASIYVDSVRTEVTTNKRGLYKIKLSSNAQHIGVSVEKYGLLSTNYTGEKKIDFVFRNPEDSANAADMKIGMIYKRDVAKTNNSINRGNNYEDFSSVTQLLNNRFPFVRAGGGTIVIGKGVNTFSGDRTPLIIVDNQRSNVTFLLGLSINDIENIRVIRRGSEAAEYGSLGASNGVIIAKTKGGIN
ncbi:MAG: hypothetical protein HKN90_09950 [Flavobacteriaceae bacterium]|nr:hypothetical protein [Flavobacteriaceae bacterium]